MYSSKGLVESPKINAVALAFPISFGRCCSKNGHFKYSSGKGEFSKIRVSCDLPGYPTHFAK